MAINQKARDRVFAVAQSLYEENSRTSFPTVDNVRQAAKISMSDASAVMKEWRQLQMSHAAQQSEIHKPGSKTDQIPGSLLRLQQELLASLWQTAQELASDALRPTKIPSKLRLAENDALNKQLSDTNKALSVELEKVQQELEQNKRTLKRSTELITTLINDQARLMKRLEDAELARKTAEARADQMERQAEDLRQELNRAEENLRMAHTTIFTNKKLTDQKEARLKEQPASAEKSPSLKKKKDAGKQ